MNYNDHMYNECLIQINNIVSRMSNGRSLTDFGLPAPLCEGAVLSNEYIQETSHNIMELQQYIASTESTLNPEQSVVYNTVMGSINKNNPKVFYLSAPGGTGNYIYSCNEHTM